MLNFSLEYVCEQYARIPACPVNWGYRLCQLYPSNPLKCVLGMSVNHQMVSLEFRCYVGWKNRRNIFSMYITRCVSFTRIIPRTKLEKEAPNEPFLIMHDSRLKEGEKRRR